MLTGAPTLIKQDLGPIVWPLGFTRDGDYYYGITKEVNDLYVAALDPETGRTGPPKKLASGLARTVGG